MFVLPFPKGKPQTHPDLPKRSTDPDLHKGKEQVTLLLMSAPT